MPEASRTFRWFLAAALAAAASVAGWYAAAPDAPLPAAGGRATLPAGSDRTLTPGPAATGPAEGGTALSGAGQLPPLSRNIFRPAGTEAPAAGELQAGPAAGSAFVLAGTISTGARRLALLEYPASQRTELVAEGESVRGITILEIDPRWVALRLGGRRRTLAVGEGSESLWRTDTALADGFEVVGICKIRARRFALLRSRSDGSLYRVESSQDLAGSRLVDLASDHMVLEVDGELRRVPVGGSFGPEVALP